MKETKRTCCHQFYPMVMSKGSSSNRKKIMKEKILKHQEWKKNKERAKIRVNVIGYSFTPWNRAGM